MAKNKLFKKEQLVKLDKANRKVDGKVYSPEAAVFDVWLASKGMPPVASLAKGAYDMALEAK